MNFKSIKIVTLLATIVLSANFAVARTYSLPISKLKTLSGGSPNKVDTFTVTVGNVYGSAKPSTNKSTYKELNSGNYIDFKCAQKIKSIVFQISSSEGTQSNLYFNDEKPDLTTLKSLRFKWDCPDSCGVNEVKMTYNCLSTSTKAIVSSVKAIQLSMLTFELYDEETLKTAIENSDTLCSLKGGNLIGVKRIIDYNNSNASYLLVKDDNGNAVDKVDSAGETYVLDTETGAKQETYDQSNWILVAADGDLVGKPIKSISGRFDFTNGRIFNAFAVETESSEESYTPNVYCPVNFMGSTQQKGADGKSYFFMTPKPYEYAKIVYAVYGGDNKFYTPQRVGTGVNVNDFAGGFEVSYRFNEEQDPELTIGCAYEFDAVILPADNSADDAVQRVVTYDRNTTNGVSTSYTVCPLNLTSKTQPTGVAGISTSKEIVGVTYYNIMGVASQKPHDGINVVLTRYDDGSTKVTKVHF